MYTMAHIGIRSIRGISSIQEYWPPFKGICTNFWTSRTGSAGVPISAAGDSRDAIAQVPRQILHTQIACNPVIQIHRHVQILLLSSFRDLLHIKGYVAWVCGNFLGTGAAAIEDGFLRLVTRNLTPHQNVFD